MNLTASGDLPREQTIMARSAPPWTGTPVSSGPSTPQRSIPSMMWGNTTTAGTLMIQQLVSGATLPEPRDGRAVMFLSVKVSEMGMFA